MSAVGRYAARAKEALRRRAYDALDERGLIEGQRVEFPSPGECELRPFEEAGPGPAQVLIRTIATVVSAGTERAIFQKLPTIDLQFPVVPGYCQCGRIVLAGGGSRYQVGELVASGGPHASVVLSADQQVYRVPSTVAPEHAALTQLGIVAMQGVRRAGLKPGEAVLVLGAGIVGLLAAQIARLAGADVRVAARSSERLGVAGRCGLATLIADAQPGGALEGLDVDAVIDATGNPEAVHGAIASLRREGRLVLLGSNRGVTRRLPIAACGRKRITMLGAHVAATPVADVSPYAWPVRREGEAFLALVADKRLCLEPLLTRRATPETAPQVYRDLSRPDSTDVAVVFDWTRGATGAIVRRASFLRGLRNVIVGRKPSAAAPAIVRSAGQRPLRFGLIGCGEIAVESGAAIRATSGCTVTYTSDVDVTLAQGLAAASNARSTSHAQELLGSDEVDVVLISTPHHLHAPLALAAIDAGKHVIVEKPMATNVADCDRMIAAAQRRGVLLSVAFILRYDPRVQRAREMLAAGAVGAPIATRIVFAQERAREYWSSGLTGRVSSDWRGRKASAGGGVLIMNACHLLDGMSWMLGTSVQEVSACDARFGEIEGVEVEDTVSLTYRYASGAIGTLEATTASAGPAALEQAVLGRQGRLLIAPFLKVWSRNTIQGFEAGRWHTLRTPAGAEREQFFAAFAEALAIGAPPPVTAQEARAVQATISAAYLASAERRTVALAEMDQPTPGAPS